MNGEQILFDAISDQIILQLGKSIDPDFCYLHVVNCPESSAYAIVKSLRQKVGATTIVKIYGDSDSDPLADLGIATRLGNQVDEKKALHKRDPNAETMRFVLLATADKEYRRASVFPKFEFQSLLHKAAKQIFTDYETNLQKFKEILYALQILDWLDGDGSGNNSEAMAWLLTKAAVANSEDEIGSELWRIGLVPDLGKTNLAERISLNKSVIKNLNTISKGSIESRLRHAGVASGIVFEKVVAFIEDRNSALREIWCHELLYFENSALTFEKWEFGVESVELENLTIKSFRDANGAVKKFCKLKQDPPNTSSERLYTQVKFGVDGVAVKPPTVVIAWDTKPNSVQSVATWQVELWLPEEFRQLDDVPLLEKTTKGSNREYKFKLDFDTNNLDPELLSGSLLVVLQVTARDEDGLVLKFKNSADDATAVSQEFEVEFEFAPEGIQPPSNVRIDNSISRPQARLSVCVASQSTVDLHEELVWKDSENLLEICYLEGELLREKRLIRTVPFLGDIQARLINTVDPGSRLRLRATSSQVFDVTDVEVKNLNLPKQLITARVEFLKKCKDEFEHAKKPQIEFLKWSIPLQNSLEIYAEAYIHCLKSADDEVRDEILMLDTFTLEVQDGDDSLDTVVLLPTHPLRAKWLCDFSLLLDDWTSSLYRVTPAEREKLVDLNFVEMMSPANSPYLISNWTSDPFAYNQEIIFGYGIFLDPEIRDHEGVVADTLSFLDAQRSSASETLRVRGISRVIDRYLLEKNELSTISLIALNCGAGGVLARIFEGYLEVASDDDDETSSKYRVDLLAYSDRVPFANPLRRLKVVQSAFRDVVRIGVKRLGLALFSPPFALAIRKRQLLVEDSENVNLAIAQGLTSGKIQDCEVGYLRKSYVDGLICGTQSREIPNSEVSIWHTSPNISSFGNSTLSRLQSAHHLAFLTDSKVGVLVPGVAVHLDGDLKNELRSLHSRADRVITLDRFVNFAWFSGSQIFGSRNKAYVLDYTPNFVEGISDRFIVSTQHREEVVGVIGRAMSEMNLFVGSETRVLDYLAMVSGRLVFQLLNSRVEARESVGLALVMHYLQVNSKLNSWIVVPVDAHLEVFGASARPDDESFKRCDLLLVRLSEGLLEIRAIEVKARQANNVNNLLQRQIREQLEDTERVLLSRFFRHSSNRVDLSLQQAHFASILHHYIDKGIVDGLIDPSDDLKYHEAADNFANLELKLTKEGYVVCIEEPVSRQLLDEPGLSIRVIGQSDLSNTEFSTRQDAKSRTVESLPPPTNPPSEPTPAGSGPSKPLNPKGSDGSMREEGVDEAGEDPSSVDVDVVVEVHKLIQLPEKTERADAPVTSVKVELGKDQSGITVNWLVSTKGSPHALILGQTGQGKSVTTRQIVKTFSENGLPSLILDFHGDMVDNPPAGATIVDVRNDGLGISPFELRGHHSVDITDDAYEISEIVGFVCDLGTIQKTHVFRALVDCYKSTGWEGGKRGERLPTISEFADAVEQVEAGAKGKNARERLLPLTDFGLFPEGDGVSFDPTGGGGGLVFDMRGLNEKVQRAAYSFIMRKVYRGMFLWEQNSQMKLAVVTDEAHKFSADKTLPKMMKEGRKFGLSCLVASQSIGDFAHDVIANSGCKIVFRTNFPDSKAVAGFVRGEDKVDLSKEIERLSVGEAFVSTPEISQAKKTRMFNTVLDKDTERN